MPIQILSDQTINKIAAGEVIENPASVVKELVENALDAKSTTITIEVERGGFSLIRVSDDGCGMSRDDLLLSLERHATSKIRIAEDLEEVLTMGFRGEALASIAAISKMKVVSAQKGSALGGEIVAEGGKIRSVDPAARNEGTTVEIAMLFYNVPARKKFQKTQGASLSEITKFLTRFALSHPEIQIRFIADRKEIIHTLPGAIEERLKTLLGEAFLTRAKKVEKTDNRCFLSGFLGSPLEARTNRLGQYLFVNGRCVRCPQIARAIYEGYGTRLSSRLHPTFVLHLTLPPEWIDVNVHPQKREIRLREEGVIQEVIRKGVMESFQGKEPPKEYPKGSWDFAIPLKFQEKKEFLPPSLDYVEEEIAVIGLFDHYLIAHGSSYFSLPNTPGPYKGMFLIDLKGAYARILYDRFVKEEAPPLQTLMVPITLEFPKNEGDILKGHLEEVLGMGVDLRPFGDSAFIIDALSPEIEEGMVQGLLEEFIEVLDQSLAEKMRQKKLAFTLSSYARSQKKGWTVVEAKQMVKELMKTTSPYDCPKGKPTVIHWNHDAIENLFQKPPC
ncbi:DNA mismatch repair endonuclease MutL [Candidatus Neptunichlamydia sp. REUL1]|uniref:DNA mismatch repair endonuclease MutL n=1 Tax=Candidatus Neptunichlamydia sp. REUL1 TaxID=3064277 RepID=UPI00292D4702|nr:DNA mismatch repair endonuclease MutL [Candidatus Neptunochlamydia sp. REUL1]